jgi:L-arabinose isomerase
MTPEIIPAIIAATVGIAGLATSVIQAVIASRERREERKQEALDEYIINALPRFCGGRQERNAGISVIGHYWHDVPRLEGLFVRLLTGQGVYIIAEGNLEKAHEYVNLERIVRLLHSVLKSTSKYDMEFTDLVTELKRQRTKVAAEEKADPNKDRRVTAKQIDDWIERLTNR